MKAEGLSETTFADLIQAGILEIGDGHRAKLSELGGSGPIFLRAGHVTDHGISFVGVDRFKDEHRPALRPKMSKPGDVVVTTKGNSIGRTAYVTAEMPEFVYSPHLSFWRSLEPARLVPGFLRYWANGPEFIGQLNGMKASTDMAPYLSLSDQRRLKLVLPGETAQRSIAAILEPLDDKIELNRRMNQTLEAMALAMFRSWFVDFDPVTARAAARQPVGLDSDVAALFPNTFEDSLLGAIPRGWRVSRIGDEVRVVGGSTPSTDEPRFWEGGTIHWATPKDLSTLTAPVLLDTERRITNEGLKRISSGLLPAGTVLLSSRAPIGYLAVSEVPTAVNQGFIAMVCTGRLPNYYVLHWAREAMDEITSRAGGTTFAEISRANFRPIPVLVPDEPVLHAYVEMARPLWEKIVSNVQESRELSTIRDAVLPKLLSGEIRLQEAEKAARRASA
jgi:type I restriction enzyme S subunit